MVTKKEGRPQTKGKRKSREELIAERRKVRNDLGSNRNVMITPKIPGLVTRWVNDEVVGGKSRVQQFLDKGWEVYDEPDVVVGEMSAVNPNVSLGSGGELLVGKTSDNKPLKAVLMCIDEQIYELDQQLKEEELKAKENSIMAESDQEGLYGNIKIN